MRVVLDANVLVSAVISRQGSPGRILDLWAKGAFDMVISPDILQETGRVIHYPKIKKKYRLPEEYVEKFLSLLNRQAILIKPVNEIKVVDLDPPDNRYLECAVEGHADFIVTGDKHLLELGEFEGTVILPPAGFLSLHKMRENRGKKH